MRFNDEEIIVSTPLRTGIGTFGGALKETAAVDLGAAVVSEIVTRSGLDPFRVGSVVVGNVLQAGQGMNPGRQVAMKAGLPHTAPAMTVNRMCGSGLQAVVTAGQEVALGEAEVAIAGGIESMDMAPFLLPKARYGYRMGMPGGQLLDSMVSDGLWDVFNDYHMGLTAENVAEKYNIGRGDADAYALRSQKRAAKASEAGYFKDQIVPIEIKQRKASVSFSEDEHVRKDTTVDGLSRLKPAFKPDGVVTAGNASGINDGAAFMVVTTRRKADELGLTLHAKLLSSAVSGVDPAYMGLGPIPAICRALEKARLSLEDVDVFEVNEAFASVALAIGRELKLPDEKLNPVGGAIALGHPIGASGAILAVKLIHELQRRQARYGVAALCIGGGMGIAAVFERIEAS
jgi:acetyl-CoA C-acetyltransferase